MACGVDKAGMDRLEDCTTELWEGLNPWLHGVCVVTFDLELGQAIESVYPPSCPLSDQDKTAICYLAFPDSNSGCMGDTKFHFRFQHTPRGGPGLSPSQLKFNRLSPASLQAVPNYLYGFVYFRQVKDPNLPRGYLQKSVIVLSRLPFVGLWLEVTAMIAPEYFKTGLQSVESACHQIADWPFPDPGDTLSLPLHGTVLQVQIPSDVSQCNIGVAQPSGVPSIIAPVHLANLFTSFSTCVYQIHLMWELVLTGEPIVVMASSPDTCSQVVHALVSMITPLRYCAEHRPYFTIHDSEFKEYTKTSRAPPPVILGVTNPFFSKTLQHWPHIIKLPEPHKTSTLHKSKVKKGVAKAFDCKAGVYTQYEPFLQRDKSIVKKLLKGVQTNRPEEVQSALLRRHLLELTQSFMIPLERYMSSLMPLHKNISPYKAAPSPWPFNPEAFLASLEKAGPQLTTGIKGNWQGLYRRFFRSPNFHGWYHQRYKAMNDKLQVVQLEALSQADVGRWVEGKQEVEVVDLLLRIRCKLDECTAQDVALPDPVRARLCHRISDILSTLPSDLQAVLTSHHS